MRFVLSFVLVLALIGGLQSALIAQTSTDSLGILDYTEPQEYEIGGITIEGAETSDENAIKSVSGLKVGDKIRIPGGAIPRAIKSLMNLRLFTNVTILKEKTLGDVLFLKVLVQERPRLATHAFKGVKKGDHDDLNDEVNKYLVKGGIVTENIKTSAANGIIDYYVGKGYLNTKVDVIEEGGNIKINSVNLIFKIDRGEKIKIQDITFTGNENTKERKLKKLLGETKEKRRLFSSSKFLEDLYEEDKKQIINYYNTIGFRDAEITSDSVWRNADGLINIDINIDEGNRYYFRKIDWKGNSIYEDRALANVLNINAGDVYNQELLDTRLRFSQDGRDVSSLYLDNGYLFFTVDPIEVAVSGDSIDLEMRIYEGPQATIDKVVINGNDRTHEHVIRRELRTIPGEKFSRSDIIRSQREIMNLGYFNAENLGINTPVNPQRGTVDIEYTVEERPSDQLELSAGWGGAGRGVIGTLGVSFNNFSVRNIFNRETWSPLPQGDGQRLSLRAQTNGRFFQSYNFSFTEPWLGGKKPNSLSVSGYYNILSNGLSKENPNYGRFGIVGATMALGRRLKWPDDNFISTTSLNLQFLNLSNYTNVFILDDGEVVADGRFNNFSITQNFTRSTINNPLFPQEGSRFSLALQVTPPYSLFRKDGFENDIPSERFKFLEYHKWKFDADWYTTLTGKLVLKTAAKIGMLGAYNGDLGVPPFERFQIGGDGLNNQGLAFFNGTEIVSLRGYEVNDLPNNTLGGRQVATPLMAKYTVELRYPLSLNPSSTIYVLAFAQGGNAWRSFEDFDPFDVRRSVGGGFRVFLPMFGVLGFDYGIGFDKAGPQTLGNYGNINIVLGFEPE